MPKAQTTIKKDEDKLVELLSLVKQIKKDIKTKKDKKTKKEKKILLVREKGKAKGKGRRRVGGFVKGYRKPIDYTTKQQQPPAPQYTQPFTQQPFNLPRTLIIPPNGLPTYPTMRQENAERQFNTTQLAHQTARQVKSVLDPYAKGLARLLHQTPQKQRSSYSQSVHNLPTSDVGSYYSMSGSENEVYSQIKEKEDPLIQRMKEVEEERKQQVIEDIQEQAQKQTENEPAAEPEEAEALGGEDEGEDVEEDVEEGDITEEEGDVEEGVVEDVPEPQPKRRGRGRPMIKFKSYQPLLKDVSNETGISQHQLKQQYPTTSALRDYATSLGLVL